MNPPTPCLGKRREKDQVPVRLFFLLRFPAFSQKEQNGPPFAFPWRFQKKVLAALQISPRHHRHHPKAAQKSRRLQWFRRYGHRRGRRRARCPSPPPKRRHPDRRRPPARGRRAARVPRPPRPRRSRRRHRRRRQCRRRRGRPCRRRASATVTRFGDVRQSPYAAMPRLRRILSPNLVVGVRVRGGAREPHGEHEPRAARHCADLVEVLEP